ncbi:hypothetical protein ABK040_002264 [Willaertia magna]
MSENLGVLFDDELSIIFSFLKVPEEINFLIISLKSKRIYKILISDSIWEQFIKNKIQFLFNNFKISWQSDVHHYRNSFLQNYKQLKDLANDNMKRRESFINNFELNLPEKQFPFITELEELNNEILQKKLPKSCCKVVVIGDGAVGKTCFIKRLYCNEFEDSFYPGCVTDNLFYNFQNGKTSASLWDTAGQEEYDKLRPLKDKYSLNNCLYNLKENLLSENEGILLAKKIKAITYLECSSKTGEGFVKLKEWFEKILTVILMREMLTHKKSCKVM